MKFKHYVLIALLALAAPTIVLAVWPTAPVNTADIDSATDDPRLARPVLLDLATKFNQVIAHVSTYAQSLLDDPDAATARTTLDVPGLNTANTFSEPQTTGKQIISGNLQTLIKPSGSSVFGGDYGSLQLLTSNFATSDAVGTRYQSSGVHNFWGIKRGTNNHVLAVNLTGTLVDAITVTNAGAIDFSGPLTEAGQRVALLGTPQVFVVPQNIIADAGGVALDLRGRSTDGVSVLRFLNNAGTAEQARIQGNATDLVISTGATPVERARFGSDVSFPGDARVGSSAPIFGGDRLTVRKDTAADAVLGVYSSNAARTSSLVFVQSETAPSTNWKLLDLRSAGGTIQAEVFGDGSARFNGAITSNKPCATGYTRITPNYCEVNAIGSAVITISGTSTACTLSTALTGVSDAKAVLVNLEQQVHSGNAVALRAITTRTYASTDTTCATIIQAPDMHIREFSAVAAGTDIGKTTTTLVVRSNSNGQFRVNHVATQTSDSTVIVAIGYFD